MVELRLLSKNNVSPFYKLNRIFLTVSEANIGGIKAYQNADFKFEGKLRQAYFRENEYHDKLIMFILKSEWKDNIP